jgi:hypothetical protein
MTASKWLAALACFALGGCSSNDCALDDDLRLFAGDGARDCGTVGLGQDRTQVDACVADALDAGVAFMARYEFQGVEAKRESAVASNSAGKVELFQWQAEPCGSGSCGPATDVQSCQGPALNPDSGADPLALPVTCESTGLAQRVCGG